MGRKEAALALFGDGFNCSQAVLSAFGDELSIDKELALKIATGFGGGVRNGEICGAVSGAIMALGLRNGHYVKDDNDSKSKAYEMTKDFTDKFRSIYGEIVCKKLLGYDLSDPEEYKLLAENGSFKAECPKYIVSAVQLLEEMLGIEEL